MTRARVDRWVLAITLAVAVVVVAGAVRRDGDAEQGRVRALPVIAGHDAPAKHSRRHLRVLFVGNSFTAANDLPAMVAALAAYDPEAPTVTVSAYAPGGSTLQRAAADPQLRSALDDGWTHAVLQEQSQVPAYGADYVYAHSVPSAHLIVAALRRHHARPVLFQTWAYGAGDPAFSTADTFTAMQTRLDDGYTVLGRTTGAPVARIGRAWSSARADRPQIQLWAPDRRHPSLAGSYLAACVLYQTLTNRTPKDSSYLAGLTRDDARSLQTLAASVAAPLR